ncbi:hypothetical protein HPB51_008485 [Rhipicephalus microplus]|uniref:Uncharacterized protein n=2 Tax=Rhipicephalus microplus TaxID=6941 RepID=A0A9J6ESB7_RHIMP|nr:uncharacterized protein LOC119179734 [Rhipicephalus microplus]KAH8037061.1 hypothetical protein HPB51_008485 [Rhipicephalus microplus]
MAESGEGVTAFLGMNEDVSDLVRRLVSPAAVTELVLRNHVVPQPEKLLELIGRCVRLRRLHCASCALPPSELFEVTVERLPHLEELELSLVGTFAANTDGEIWNLHRIASRRAAIVLSRSCLRRLYVEVGGDHNFELLRELLGFYPRLTELHVHVVRGGTFSKALSVCLHLHNSLLKLESFTFTSELPLPFPYEPDLSSPFSVIAAVCANLRHKWSDASWSSLGLLEIANSDRISALPPQMIIVAVLNDETERLFSAASRPRLWTHVRQLCLLLLTPNAEELFYPAAGGAFRECLRNFFSVALEHVVELNLSSLHVRPNLDLMDLLQERMLNTLKAFSVPPCAFRSQSAVRRLEASCPNLVDLDVRIQRLQRHSLCASCELLLSPEWNERPRSKPKEGYYRYNAIDRLTLCDVSSDALLWFLECYGAAVRLRLVNWCYFDKLHYGRLCEHLGENGSIRCLVIQHPHLPIQDELLQVSLSLMASLRHLCLLTWMPVGNIEALLYLDQILDRARQLECVHIHYKHHTEATEQRVTWLRRGQDGVLSRGGPCIACCSTATFIGMVKPVNRDCETVFVA